MVLFFFNKFCEAEGIPGFSTLRRYLRYETERSSTYRSARKIHLGLREVWVRRSGTNGLLQEMLSDQPCTLLSFSPGTAERISLWVAL